MVTMAISWAASAIASAVAAEGFWIPETFLTYCSAAASTSSVVAGGSSPRSSVMLRHMRPTLRVVLLQIPGRCADTEPVTMTAARARTRPVLAGWLAALAALIAVTLIAAGCQQNVRAGARCRTTDFGADATHVLRCQRGKWVRVATKEQVAQLLIAIIRARATAPPATPPSGSSDAALADTARPNRVIGDGSPASCTSDAVVNAVALGGVIAFDCGSDPVTIVMTRTAKIFNDTGPEIVIDGGNRVTLSGAGQRRILYMNTCDRAQRWTTSRCQDQDHPRLTIQRLTFVDGNATGESTDGGGGGAVFVRGGRVRILDSTFRRNVCDPTGPDVGGGALRVLSQSGGQPVIVARSTFGGAPGEGNQCSNGGALSSIGVSWQVSNSVISHNRAVGVGANPARSGTPGGGNGGGICLDGNTFT